ncbi:MAG: YebC/PmpR family DNA-binding transcriptional regulator [Clostridia bacterium]|nr:YebC/PmpR family DNA-binding transcriptional regulator [Clostridia bacterium]
MGRHGTIANRKASQDAKRAAMFTKYVRAIIVAAKAGGNPEYNASLRVAIEKAKAISLPNDKIERAIKKGTGELEGESYTEQTFEGYGPGGVAIIVDTLSDNSNRVTASVRSAFAKNGGNLGTNGCVTYMFQRKGVLLIEKTDEVDEDTLMEAALEAGAEDFKVEEDCFEVYTDPADYNDVFTALQEAGYEFVESDVEYVPSMEATPDEFDLPKLRKLIDALEENDDVQKVSHNCAVDLYED